MRVPPNAPAASNAAPATIATMAITTTISINV
jgi:hypothetical protein